MTRLTERLRARKGFWLNGGTWVMGASPDLDCQDAANELDRLEAELADAKMKLNLIRHIIDRDDVARDRSLSMVPTG